MILNSPTRSEIEDVLARIPVAVSKSARTKEKKVARNERRRDAVKKHLEQNFPDPRVVKMILDDLQSYMGFEEEVDDA